MQHILPNLSLSSPTKKYLARTIYQTLHKINVIVLLKLWEKQLDIVVVCETKLDSFLIISST